MGGHARWTARLALPAVLLVTVLAACSAPQQAQDAPTAVVAANADCLSKQVLDDLQLATADQSDRGRTPRADAPEAGRVPDGFVPVSVVVCLPGGTLHDSSGTWVAVTVSRREGDLEPLVVALRRPSAQRGGTCSTSSVVAPALWLVDALGQAVRPLWPTDRCGNPQEAVRVALDALEETDSEQYPVRLTAPADPRPSP